MKQSEEKKWEKIMNCWTSAVKKKQHVSPYRFFNIVKIHSEITEPKKNYGEKW